MFNTHFSSELNLFISFFHISHGLISFSYTQVEISARKTDELNLLIILRLGKLFHVLSRVIKNFSKIP